MAATRRRPRTPRGLRRGLGLLPATLALTAAAQAPAQGPAPPPPAAAASQPQAVSPTQRVVVTGSAARDDAPFSARADKAGLARQRTLAGDSARLLLELPGVSLYGAGGVSSLPALHGLADERVRTQVDGMDLLAACPNHMNPALSYIDPSAVGAVRVFPGVAPVSLGGDSIGGSIQVDSAPPEFALTGQWLQQGRLSAYARSNGAARGGSASATLATAMLHLTVNAATAQQGRLRAARAFKPAEPGSEAGPVIPGDEIGSSAYQSHNQQLRLAWRSDHHLLRLNLGRQHIGFEGFPNQRMDMTANLGSQANLRYTGSFDWGELSMRAWQQKVDHAMDMGPDRYFYGFGMPMLTQATTRGVQVQADLNLAGGNQLRFGAERLTQVLHDWWPPVGGSMGPRAFWNIDDGRRIRAGAFAEWEARWGGGWSTLAGVRADQVRTDAAPVQGYDNGLGAIWGNEAAAFNAQARGRRDNLFDLALLARHRSEAGTGWELGLAHKSRAPSLYQRYPWSTQPMAALMNNFVGDGNGYVGNLDLRPERALTLAASAQWQASEENEWQLKATLHATRVHDYIDARRCDFGQCSAQNRATTNGFVLLQYANQVARLGGLDVSGRMRLWRSATWGDGSASAVLGFLHGRNQTTGDGLYNIMPANARLTLELRRGPWAAAAEALLVAAKRRVSQVRNEMPTAGHALLSLRASHEWAHARLDLGVDNLFNRFHNPPLGGAYVGQGPSMTTAGIPWGTPVPGPGRSFSVALQLFH